MDPKLERGRTWLKICQALIRLIALSTWIRTFAILMVSKHWLCVNWSLAENLFGGIYKLAPLRAIRSWISKPLSARYWSPISINWQKLLFSTISLSLILPGYNWLTNVIHPLSDADEPFKCVVRFIVWVHFWVLLIILGQLTFQLCAIMNSTYVFIPSFKRIWEILFYFVSWRP